MNKTNIDRVAKQLYEIKPRICWKDREDAAVALRKSTNTVNNYLNNKVSDEVLALELLKFLKGRVAERERVLDDLIND